MKVEAGKREHDGPCDCTWNWEIGSNIHSFLQSLFNIHNPVLMEKKGG